MLLSALSVGVLLAGCAGTPVLQEAGVDSSTHSGGTTPESLVRLADARDVSLTDLPTVAAQKTAVGDNPEEPFDPFAKADEAVGEEYDPWESFNSTMFEFNRKLDKYALKPFAQGYDFIVPDFVQVGISNMFYNIRFVPRFFNNVFQGKVKGASIELGRFLLNSTVGYAGFLDLAKEIDLVTPEEDFGQTLGFYGVKSGPYLVLPLMQPFTIRDLTGYVTDIFLNPVNWLVAPIISVGSIPSLINQKNTWTITFVQMGARAGDIINERSRNLEKYQGVEEATFDLYTAVRNAYLQSRARAIKE
jgi:phospholipid-binding lipoprotein MlaA